MYILDCIDAYARTLLNTYVSGVVINYGKSSICIISRHSALMLIYYMKTASKRRLTLNTRVTHRHCISDIGMMPPSGWKHPITAIAIVEGEMSGGNTYLYRLTSLSLTSNALWSIKGKPNRYPVAQMMASMLSATDPSTNS